MKKVWKCGNNNTLRGMLAITCAILFFVMNKSICFADATGQVTAPSAKIRKSADINSEVIASSSSGKTITITAEVTDASGTVWYEVYVDSATKGYIRSDLVSRDASSGDVPSRTAAQSAGNSSDAQTGAASGGDAAPADTRAEGAEIPPETPMDAQYASVKVPAAKVRGRASTTSGIVGTIPENTQVTLSGKTAGSDSREWYYITFTGTDGQEKTGYVRSDLVELGEMVPAQEPQAPEEQEPQQQEEPQEVPENKDYELVYEEGEWYLYNHLENNKNKLSEIMEAAQAQEFNDSVDDSTITKQRIAIIVLAGIIIIMAFAITLMFFKIRDAYYEAYEDDDEADDRTYNNRRDTVKSEKSAGRDQRQPQPQARRRTTEYEKRMPVKEVTYDEDEENPIKPAPKKKAKNFMMDDEDFEFEFLNMKNKDIR